MGILGTILNPFGDNSSHSANTSSTSSQTNYSDQRMVNDGGSLGVGGSGNTLTLSSNTNTLTSNYITATDSGAVAYGASLGAGAIAGANGVAGSGLRVASELGGTALNTASQIASASLAMGGNVAVQALQSNATNTSKLLDTVAALDTGQQRALDISATLAGLLASKATGTADTGLQTAGAATSKTWAIAAVCALGLVLLLKHRR